MKKLLLGGIAFVAVAGPARAVDLGAPVYRRPVVVAAPVFSWTGFYVGGNFGYSWGSARNTYAFAQDNTGGGFDTFYALDSPRLNGLVGGLQGGYNWRFRNFFYGVEIDWEALGERAGDAFNGSIFVPGASNPTVTAFSARQTSLGTVRRRAGVISGPWLLYATGGLAYGRISTSGILSPTNPDPVIQHNLAALWDQSSTRVGWTIGGGIESAISGNWTWKREYLYVDLGTVTANGALPAGNCYGTGGTCNGPLPLPGPGTVSSRITDNILRIGLNYKFGNYYTPVVTK